MDKKEVFIDSNIFISCSLGEMDGLNFNILEQILKKLDNGKMILVLPEIVEKETVSNLEKVFIFLKHKKANTIFTKERFNDEKSKTNNLIDGIKDNLKAFFLEKIGEKEKEIFDLLSNIFKHNNTKLIELSEELIIKGIKRALKIRAPFTGANKDHWTENKPRHSADQDCIIFETIVIYIKIQNKTKKDTLIMCTNDGDYFQDKERKNIHNEITEDMMCKAKVYSNPLEMLNNEFDENYTGKQIKEFENEKVVFISNTPRGMGLWDADNIYNYPSVITETGDYGVLTTRNDDIISLPKGVRFCPNCGNNIEYLFSSPLHILNTYQALSYLPCTEQVKRCSFCNCKLRIC